MEAGKANRKAKGEREGEGGRAKDWDRARH